MCTLPRLPALQHRVQCIPRRWTAFRTLLPLSDRCFVQDLPFLTRPTPRAISLRFSPHNREIVVIAALTSGLMQTQDKP